MSDVFESAAQAVLSEQPSASPEQTSNPPNQTTQGEQEAKAIAIAELDKMDKFKLDGQEWTLKDLKAAIMRQKDYTQKTQNLAKEREALESEKKFRENLAWDLMKMRENPKLVEEFLKVYPKSFHRYADEFLKNTQPEAKENVQSVPQIPVELLSKVSSLEQFVNEYKIKENEQSIQKVYAELSEKFPETKSKIGHREVMAMAYETMSAGTELNSDVWESIFKSVNDELSEFKKSGLVEKQEAIKKQTEANAKARDVGAGGGMAGRAPAKFKRFDDLAKHAEGIFRDGSS